MERTFLQVLGLTGTVEILKYLNEHNTATYKELRQFASIATLNRRLNQLIWFGLIEHHLKQFKRSEHYSITEKGKRVFSLVQQLITETT